MWDEANRNILESKAEGRSVAPLLEVQGCGREEEIMHKSTYKYTPTPSVEREEKAPSLNTKQLRINEPFSAACHALQRAGREEARGRGERKGLRFSLGSDSRPLTGVLSHLMPDTELWGETA